MTLHLDPIITGVAAPQESLQVTSPYDLQTIGSVGVSGEDHVKAALATASERYRNRAGWLSKAQRKTVLLQLAQLMETHFDDLAMLAAMEGGKPLQDSQVEVRRAIEGVHLCVEAMQTLTGSVVPMQLNAASANKYAFTQWEPIGVVVAVSAFNHPINLIVHQVAPAIAAGCPVIVKPAATTPLSCFKFVNMLGEAGLPAGWCQCLLTKDNAVAEMLVTSPDVAFFSFIGSPAVGWMLRSKLSPGTRCALEHGGAAPLVAARDCDIDQLIGKVLKGGFYHAGQVCVSVQRVFVDKAIADTFVNGLVARASSLIVGDPTDDKTEVGPLITPAEVDRVDTWVKQAVEQGAELLLGGDKLTETLYRPTVLLNPSQQSLVSQKEIFGPVVCVYEYTDIDAAVALANSLPFAFQASVFTRSIDTAMKAFQALDATAVMVNEHTAFRVDWMPFAGLRQSGLGVGGIEHTFRDMQIEKMMVIHSDEI